MNAYFCYKCAMDMVMLFDLDMCKLDLTLNALDKNIWCINALV